MPKGFPNPHNQVCLLKKSLYGLKQASRQWHAKLVSALKELDFFKSKNDYSLFTNVGEHITILVVYVDDILIIGSDEHEVIVVKQDLHNSFTIKDLGAFHYCLGIEISYSDKAMNLTQHKYSKELLQESGITSFHIVVTPLPINLKLLKNEGKLFSDPTLYKKLIGKLNFLTHTTPNLSYTIQTLSQFMQTPRVPHWQALKHTLNYIYSTYGQGIILQGNSKLSLQAFSYSDWAACPNTRRSVTDYILMLGNSPISWKSKKQ